VKQLSFGTGALPLPTKENAEPSSVGVELIAVFNEKNSSEFLLYKY